MASNYKIFWTAEAINNFESILSYLSDNWTPREIENFKIKLSKQLNLIQQNPFLFPVSPYNPKLHKAVLSKQIIVFYEVSEEKVYLNYLYNTTQNIDKIK